MLYSFALHSREALLTPGLSIDSIHISTFPSTLIGADVLELVHILGATVGYPLRASFLASTCRFRVVFDVQLLSW